MHLCTCLDLFTCAHRPICTYVAKQNNAATFLFRIFAKYQEISELLLLAYITTNKFAIVILTDPAVPSHLKCDATLPGESRYCVLHV